jgi:peptidoglycan/LPS O-acetylase OafA/YrhL
MLNIAYRPDIDGLRAFAVVVVILFHGGIAGFDGGFVGVDVFFVISGYLITSVILREMNAGVFSVWSFWTRRIRRIFPAVLLVVALSLAVFWLVFPPQYYLELGRSALAQTMFISNILFWRESGYFDAAAHFQPLLHTWSLSVEEQFYVIFPVFLIFITRFFANRRFRILLGISTGSLALSVWGATADPSGAFYLLPTRAWELGIGCMLAFAIINRKSPPVQSPLASELLAGLGMLGLVLTVFGFDRTTPFPSYRALLPCLSTALIIWVNCDRRTIVGKVLAVRPLVFLGLISYSLYLWHWPVLVLERALMLETPSVPEKLGAIVVSGLLAWLTYRFVETPVRRNITFFTNRRLALGSVAALALVAMAGGSIHLLGGIPSRLSESALPFAAAGQEQNPRRLECVWSKQQGEFSDDWFCRPDATLPKAVPRILIWGDSHADALQPLLDGLARENGIESHFAAYSACPAIAGLDRINENTSHECRKFNDYMVNYAIKNEIQNVLLIARFNLYTNGHERIKQHFPAPLVTKDNAARTATVESAQQDFRAAAAAMFFKLAKHGIRSYVLLQVPNFNIEPTAYAQKLAIRGMPIVYERPRREIVERQHFVSQTFAELVKFRVTIIDPTDTFCDEQVCSPYINGRSAYRDEHHLSSYGAALLRPLLAGIFASLL